MKLKLILNFVDIIAAWYKTASAAPILISWKSQTDIMDLSTVTVTAIELI